MQEDPPDRPQRGAMTSVSILVVDGDADVRKMLEVVLGEYGFIVRHAASATAALDTQRCEPSGIVLLDVQFADTEGPEMVKEIHKINPDAHCFFTGHSEKYTRDDLIGLGAAGVLKKPFRLEALRQMVWELIQKRKEP
jgi:DNA-binding NtrC family response regulator